MAVSSNLLSFFSVAVALLVWLVLDHLYAPKQLPGEPPVVSSPIPYIGHILGLLHHGTRYYQRTSAKCKLPIYTLNMLNGKVYVVTSPDLIAAVNRNSKALAFNPFIAQLGKRITGHDEATSQIVQHNLNGEHGPGYVTEVHDGIVAALLPGTHLESMTEQYIRNFIARLDSLEIDQDIKLFAWTRNLVTLCSTRAIYGPGNPFSKNSKFVDLFWDFDRDLNLLIADFLPSIIVPKGNRARSELGIAFEKYFEDYIAGQTESSAMIQARQHAATKHGISSWNQGRLEVGTLLGVLANTVPSVFYLLVHIYSDQALLRDIRDELEVTCVSTVSPAERSLHIMTMREKCRLLHSTFQELLRVHALGAGARFVREDTMLDDQYLLKKGMVIQMPMAVMHSDPLIWGPDAVAFQPRRFLKHTEATQGSKQKATAYRPFGGGASLCPGRHFVALEALALTAYMVLRFDMSPSNGQWSIPAQKQESLATNVFPPEKDILIKFSPRKGFEKVTWVFDMQ